MAPSRTTRPTSPTNGSATPKDRIGNAKSAGSETTESPAWRLDSLPGKGKALIATHALKPGTLLLADPPLLTTACITSGDNTESDLARALRALPKESQRAFLSLHNNFPGQGSPLSNIVRSNGYPLGPTGVGGVFANVSRLNHSCRPNAKHVWNAKLGVQTVYIVRDVAEGEELTLSYLPGGTSSERKETLREHFGFECRCEVCSLPDEHLRKSDARILRAQTLTEGIEDEESQIKCPSKLLRNGRTLAGLYAEEEILDDRVGNIWWEMFKIVNGHRDQARASVFAKRYSDSKLVSEGPHSANVLEMAEVVKNPSQDSSFGKLLKKKQALKRRKGSLDGYEDTEGWSLAVSGVPKGLDDTAFEKWLWRQDIS